MRNILILILFSFLFSISCEIFEPIDNYGSLKLIIVDKDSEKLKKANETLSSVQCILKLESEEIYNNELELMGDSFHGEIKGLKPSDNYSIVVYGKDSNNEIISMGYKEGISVTEGKQTTVFINWSSININQGLVGYYPFNGNANDESGNGNHASVFGAILIEDRFGNVNNAYSFDGIDDYINLNINQIPIVSITFWFKGSNGTLISTHEYGDDSNNFFLHLDAYGCGIAVRSINGWTNNLCVGELGTYSDNKWYFVTFTSNNGVHKLYISGDLESDYTGNSLTDNRPYILGRREKPGTTAFYTGIIDDVRLYNRILSESEINMLFNE